MSFAAPFHPIFVHFTIALTAASLAFDLIGLVVPLRGLAETGWWTLVGALVTTPLTLASGVVSRLRLPMEEGEARGFLRTHMALGPVFFGLLVVQGLWRAVVWQQARDVPGPYLVWAALTVAVMTLQGYLGGELVYRFGAEVRGRYPRLPIGSPDDPVP